MSAARYAVIVRSAEAEPLTTHGDLFVVLDEPEHWVEATSTYFTEGELLPSDLKIFRTREEADEFGKRWKGHPWWVVPFQYFVIEVKPIEETTVTTVGYTLESEL